MKLTRVLIGWMLACALAAPAWAHHVVWLDFSEFDLSAFPSINGNSPPTANDVEAVRQQVIANMTEDYAPFDIYFTPFQPPNGRYTRVRILRDGDGNPNKTYYGCAGGGCCRPGGTCGGNIRDDVVSSCEVYSASFAGFSAFRNANATTARVANGISHTASHELGHVLLLGHCHAADDAITLGCTGITTTTNDQNTRWHIMASGSSWKLTTEERASRDRFFSIHSSRRLLLSTLQVRNHWNLLPNVNAGFGLADLAYGRVASPQIMNWFVRTSTTSGTQFENAKLWVNDAGNASDLFYIADVTGDDRADLVYGRVLSATQVAWFVQRSLPGDTFGNVVIWRTDAGDAGDIFRLADVNGDGRDDLVYGRRLSADVVRWYVRLSTGNGFGNVSTWVSDAGGDGYLFLISDVDNDGDSDLVYGIPGSAWYVRRSNGSSFGSLETFWFSAGATGDLFFLPDLTGDGNADLVSARVNSDTAVQWSYHQPNPDAVAIVNLSNDAGDAGDIFRFGYAGGDGRVDLFYARPLGMASLTATPDLSLIRWYGRPSNSGVPGFGAVTTWRSDAGDEGDTFP